MRGRHSTLFHITHFYWLPHAWVALCLSWVALYLREFYQDSHTSLRIGPEHSGPIVVGRDVKQGDPLSPRLFNALIDWPVASLDPELGWMLVAYGSIPAHSLMISR